MSTAERLVEPRKRSPRRRAFRTRRPVHLLLVCLTVSMGLIGAVAVAAVV